MGRSNYTLLSSRLNCKKKKWGNATPSLFLLPSILLSSPPLPRSGSLKTSYGVWELCKLPSGVLGEAPAAYTFWCILARKSHLARQHLFTNALRKHSCIGKKCRNDVQKFTPTKISGAEFRISGGGNFPRLYVWKKH